MYVAVRDAILSHAGYSSVSQGLRDLDLDAVELALGRDLSLLGPADGFLDLRRPLVCEAAVAQLRGEFCDLGIHIPALLLANNFNSADPQAEVRWVVEAVRIAEGLGAEAVRLDSAMTGQQELPLQARVELFAGTVRQVLEATPELAMPLGIENHGVQGNDPAWMQGVLDAVASPRLGLALDTGNFYWAGLPLDSVYEAVRQFGSHVKHTHCKNISFAPEHRNQPRDPGWGYGEHVCPIPDGDVDHYKVASILHRSEFCGGLTIEDESLSKFEGEERLRQLRRDADHLADVAAANGGSRLFRGPSCGIR